MSAVKRRVKLVYLCFQVRQNKDGSKIQVVRESAVSTSSANDPSQSVTFQQNSFVYINGSPGEPCSQDKLSAHLPLRQSLLSFLTFLTFLSRAFRPGQRLCSP